MKLIKSCNDANFFLTFSLTLMTVLILNFSLFSQENEPASFWPNHIKTRCPKPPQGPPGPRGPIGSLSAHYASVWSTTAQEIPPTNTPVEVIFENDQVTSKGIVHPVSGNQSLFQIKHSGVYLIIWNVTATYVAADPNFDTTLNFTLTNVSTGTDINPGINGSATLTDDEAKTITGQTSVFLPEGTVIQLQVANGRSILQILNRTLTITQIANVL